MSEHVKSPQRDVNKLSDWTRTWQREYNMKLLSLVHKVVKQLAFSNVERIDNIDVQRDLGVLKSAKGKK